MINKSTVWKLATAKDAIKIAKNVLQDVKAEEFAAIAGGEKAGEEHMFTINSCLDKALNVIDNIR